MQARRRYFTSPRWNWRRGRSKVLSTRTRSATSRKPLHSHKVILSHTAAWPQFTDAPARFQEPTKKNKELPSSAKRPDISICRRVEIQAMAESRSEERRVGKEGRTR